jgi:hypothetical protein
MQSQVKWLLNLGYPKIIFYLHVKEVEFMSDVFICT